MKLSMKWLSEYVEVPESLKEFCDRLDLTGTGVEGVENTGDNFDKIVTAQVVSKEKHPDSDHMWVCMVDVGEHNLDDEGNPTPLQIVCGAQNFNEGDHIVTALIGAVLPGDFKIKRSKLRGVASHGMNCSSKELGLSDDHEGIIILPEDAPIGMPYGEYLGLSDTILDLEITPNRPDCMSVLGLAREVGAMYNIPVCEPIYELEEARNKPDASTLVDVDIQDPKRCKRYTARIIKNVKIGPSPAWLVERITAAGGRSINNVVDVTNYILYLYGQPLHAFDYDKIVAKDGKAHISVRAAEDGEKITTLDGVERTLTSDMTLIANHEGGIALAGVMGGEHSEVSDETSTILLETATFDSGHTSRTSRNLRLISESSMRYERIVDDNPIADISASAAALLAEVSGGVVCPGIVDIYPEQTKPCDLEFRVDRFRDMMGIAIHRKDIVSILEALDCIVDAPAHASTLNVTTPTNRPDLTREIDLYEEVLRIWGMDKVEPTLPKSSKRVGKLTKDQLIERSLHQTLMAHGLHETTTYSFSNEEERALYGLDACKENVAVELLNPMTAEHTLMREMLLPGLMKSVSYNIAHGTQDIQLYEYGTVFRRDSAKSRPQEIKKIGAVLSGSMMRQGWNIEAQPFDFFDAKGIVEDLAQKLNVAKVRFSVPNEGELPFLQPGRGAIIKSRKNILGWVGEIHPLVCKACDIDVPVVAFELDYALLVESMSAGNKVQPLSEYPAIEVDVAFVVDEEVTNETLMQRIKSAGSSLLSEVHLFDVYRDESKLGEGKKSMAYSLHYQSLERTLTNEEVDKAREKLIKKVSASLGAQIRS